MKLKRLVQKERNVMLSIDECNRISMFVQLLIQIDRRVKLCKQKEPKTKQKSKICLLPKGPRDSGPYIFTIWSSHYIRTSYNYFDIWLFFKLIIFRLLI